MSDEETATLEPEVATETTADPAPATEPGPDPEELKTLYSSLAHYRDVDAELDEAYNDVRTSKDRLDQAKVEAKEAKAVWESAVDRLQRVIRERHQSKMDFAKPKPVGTPLNGHAAAAPPPAEDDAWKDRPIRELSDLSPGILTALEDIGVTTIGRLEHLRGGQDPDYPRGLNSVKGFGEAKITKIEDAVTNWLDRNRDSLHAAAAEEATAGKGDPAPAEEAGEGGEDEEIASTPPEKPKAAARRK